MYLILDEQPVIIDTGLRSERRFIEMFLSRLVEFSNVKKVIFTHLHYDHIGNFDLFPNATFYASQEEIESCKQDKKGTILKEDIAERFNVNLQPMVSDSMFEVIKTPGHTKGSMCLLYKKQKILFSGDTIFSSKIVGRTDLPTSVPDLLQQSLMQLAEIKFKVLCPGHDYD